MANIGADCSQFVRAANEATATLRTDALYAVAVILAYDKTGITITLRKQKQMPSRASGKGVWQAGLRRNLPRPG